MITYGSVCSGIEAASVAWECLGWHPAWFAQFDPEHNYKRGPDFPSAVLAYRWPNVANLGDMTKIAAAIRAGHVEAPDVLVGGTPCQAFSIAGLRNGLSDSRGQLTLAFFELVNAIDEKRRENGKPPVIVVWENVPGVLNTKDNAFGCFLAGLAGESRELESPGKRWTNAGYVLGPERAVCWRVLDAQFFGVAQRRRRVFVVASARTDIDPAKILFESEGVRRDSAPRRDTPEEAAQVISDRVANGSHWDGQHNPHPTLNQSFNTGGIGASNQEIFSQRGAGIVGAIAAHSFTGGAGGRPEGAAVGHFIPVAYCLQHAQIGRKDNAGPQGKGWQEEVGFTLDSRDSADAVAVAFAENSRGEIRLENGDGQISGALSTGGGKPGQGYPAIMKNMAVRRLTPVECERLQGFPDNHTLIPRDKRKQITADEYAYLRHHFPNMTAEEAYRQAADGPRYKAIGNSMAVPVMRWIGRRIQEALCRTH